MNGAVGSIHMASERQAVGVVGLAAVRWDWKNRHLEVCCLEHLSESVLLRPNAQ